MVCRRSSHQEVLWFTNENFGKVIHRESASARDGFGALALPNSSANRSHAPASLPSTASSTHYSLIDSKQTQLNEKQKLQIAEGVSNVTARIQIAIGQTPTTTVPPATTP